MAAGPGHTFASLGSAIDTAFGRWDHSHLHEFRFLDDTKIGVADPDWAGNDILDSAARSWVFCTWSAVPVRVRLR
jgi:hypothetical protein